LSKTRNICPRKLEFNIYRFPNNELIDDFIYVIETGSDDDIIDFIDENYDELEAYFDTDDLDGVHEEELVVSTEENTTTETDFIIYTDSSDDITAYQFVSE